MIGKANNVGGPENSAEELLAIEERDLTEIITVAVELVEDIVDNGRLLQERRGRAADAHAALQPLEVAARALVKHTDLSVEERLAGGEARGQIRQLRVVRGDVASGTRTQLDAAVADA